MKSGELLALLAFELDASTNGILRLSLKFALPSQALAGISSIKAWIASCSSATPESSLSDFRMICRVGVTWCHPTTSLCDNIGDALADRDRLGGIGAIGIDRRRGVGRSFDVLVSDLAVWDRNGPVIGVGLTTGDLVEVGDWTCEITRLADEAWVTKIRSWLVPDDNEIFFDSCLIFMASGT